MIAKILDILTPRFITEWVVFATQNGELHPVFPAALLEENEPFERIAKVKGFVCFGFMFAAKRITKLYTMIEFKELSTPPPVRETKP